ncbi:Shikimate kinase I [Lachnospiraceae bacterium TWA4]|nr:Shikimate kinase I [Lachnospiraceae bacterium TWA4]
MNDNIILIGMPAAGKSTVGVLLAKRLGYKFIDTDLVIQEKEGKLLKEIIEEVGNDGFCQVEDRINAEIEASHSVIAPGGSVIYCENAMKHFKEIGKVVYLKISYEELVLRVGDVVDRGVVLKDGMTLLDMYNERCVLCEKYADITVDEDGKTAGNVVDYLREVFEHVSD